MQTKLVPRVFFLDTYNEGFTKHRKEQTPQ